MPLRDHFRDPIATACPWHVFHGNWATKMVDRLNSDLLTERYTAQGGRHLGTRVEVDVATFRHDEDALPPIEWNGHRNGSIATATQLFTPPAATLSLETGIVDPDVFEVRVFLGCGGWELVATVELVSESNKDRGESRRAFAVKCAAYLQAGISVVVVDAVTSYSANLHDDIRELIDAPEPLAWSSPTGLSVLAYRTSRNPVVDDNRRRLEVWGYQLSIGDPLPTVPLRLATDLAVPLELERTYEAACRSLRIR